MPRTLRNLACAVAASAALAGCGHLGSGVGPLSNPSGLAANPVVTIDPDTGKPVVFPDPLFFRKGETDVEIVWRLPANQGLRFADDGIVVEGELTNNPDRRPPGAVQGGRAVLVREQDQIVGCKPINANAEFTCLNRHTRPGTFKYRVRVVTPGGGVAERDPQIMND